MLSVVIPTAHEPENSFLQATLKTLSKLNNVEVICVDKSEAVSRAERLNIGFERACGSMILFHHPRSTIEEEGLKHLISRSEEKIWGAFTHKFDQKHWLLKFTSWYSNKIRGLGRSIFYLDHCIFFHRSLRQSPLPAIEIFEDTVLSAQLRQLQPPILLPFISTTSAIRFTKNGLWKQAVMNQILKIAFTLNIPDQILSKIYEKNLNLNNQTNKPS
ncbi:MAG: hypothetical protein H7061_07445 [Bdellovibrionaceae bacterium]|nr:hypothetical protein [Bdellovibrio sp.]